MKNILILLAVGVVALGGLFLLVQADSGTKSNEMTTGEEAFGFKGLLSAAGFSRKIQSGDFVVLDVRTLGEYKEQRVTEDATLIDFYANDFKQQLSKLDKSKNYLIYCRSGNRSGQTVNIMEELGFESFYDLQGGINAWNQAGLPTVSG
ncbi:MAG: rhodanese-like domain-containing protein [Candidatus Pacebacteria bacterium]|nr:rhodanese-like domain-containing protein [Candidatus Paceibacterota bacterium]